MVLFFYGYDLSEPGIGLGGLFPRPSQSTTPSRRSHLLSWCRFFFPGMSVPNRLSVWVGSLPLLYDPLLPFHSPLFPSLLFFFLGLLNLPSLSTYGTFQARNRALPRPLRCPRRTMRAFHPAYRFGWASSSSLSTHHHHPPPSTGEAQTVHLSC